MAGDDGSINRYRQHGKRVGEDRWRIGKVAERFYRDVQPQGARPARQHVRIAEKDERRNWRAAPLRIGLKRNVRSDPRGIAESERKRFVGTGHRA